MKLQRQPFLYAIFASLAAILLGMAWGETALEQARYMVRWSARVGLPLVLIIYTASALNRLWPGNALLTSVYKNRRSWGLSFALTHTVHLFAIIHYLNTPGSIDPGPLGILGFAFIYVMAFSSNSNSIKQLGKWWKRIHTTGTHIIGVYYLVAYAEMLFEPEMRLVGIVAVPLILGAGVIRVVAWRKKGRANVGRASQVISGE
jgi:methionine sulfoxide reductase heme-binding subunit